MLGFKRNLGHASATSTAAILDVATSRWSITHCENLARSARYTAARNRSLSLRGLHDWSTYKQVGA
eukprot:8216977-Pyramimonas_sp.AAC.1